MKNNNININEKFLKAFQDMHFIVETNYRSLYIPEIVKHNLSIPMIMVLKTCMQHDGINMSKLSNILNIKKNTLTSIIDKLVSTKFISRQRTKNDRRKVLLKTTLKTQRIIEKIEKQMNEKFVMFIDILTDTEKKSIIKILKKLQITMENRL